MKKTIFLTLFAAIIVVFTSCQKQPTANFITDKTTYMAGETIVCTNTSTDGDHYLWTFPGDQTSSYQSVNYTTSVDYPVGDLTIKLEAFSANGKKSSQMVKTVTIEAAKGDAMFWSDNAEYIITVTLGGVDRQITSIYSSVPDCGSTGCANYSDITPGTYSFYATDGIHEWESTITITADNCSKMRLYLSKAVTLDKPLYEPQRIK